MNVQIFGSTKSNDSKKAERWFKERRIKYQFIDLPKKGFSLGEYRSIRQKLGFQELINTQCKAYQDLYVAYVTPEAAEDKLFENPQLFNMPIVRNGKQVTVGYRPEVWETWE